MSSVNKVILVGNVGSDPEIKTFNNGGKVANFSLATTEKWRDKKTQEYVSKTEWTKISVFSEGLVSVIERYVKKGVKLYIEGRLQTRKWTDSSGNDKYITEVVLKGYGGTLVLLDNSNANADKPRLDVSGYNRNVVPGLDDEIPF
jgi:single-strand DNA-binding protein